MTKICAVAVNENQAKQAVSLGAEAIEYRVDLFKKIPEEFSFDKSVVNIVTCRDKIEEKEILEKAVSEGADFVDVDYSSPCRDDFGSHTICSYHDFKKTPDSEKILEIFSDLEKSGIPKGAFFVNSISDLLEIYKVSSFLKKRGRPFILIGIGSLGEITRIRSDKLGSMFNYCPLSSDYKTAEGQLTFLEASDLRDATVTGIIGYPLAHTFSPAIHNAAFSDLKIHGRYLKFPCREDELCKIPELIKAYDITGLNVTIPYKEKIIPYLSSIDETASDISAVNTIDKNLKGFNTDICGIEDSLRGKDLSGKNLIIGAGGAAKSAAHCLSKKDVDFSVAGRTFEKAKTLAEKYHVTVADINDIHGFDLIINTTPVSPKNISFEKNSLAFDFNYPASEFLREAKKSGAMILSGKTMLISQAAESFKIWTSIYPNIKIMDEAFEGEI